MTRDHAKKILAHLRNGKSDLMLMDALDMAISALSESDNKWIPVSERLPKEDGRYLCTYATEFGDCVDFGKLYKGDWFVGRVTAWQPLPESYKGESEEKSDSDNKGEWIDNGNGSYTCSNCKTEWTTSQIEMCFCPTCGNPKVRGDQTE